ncbi:MAG: OadG family protein [Clostridia bacterium]|nr:OadG family protein [Clostridia bacterium]
MNLQLLLNISPDQFNAPLESWSDRISMAVSMLLRGMGMVFFVLAVLWGILELFHVLVYRASSPKSKASQATKPAPVKKSVPEKAAAPAPAPVSAPQTEDAALVAAITAAVAAYLEQSPATFRVVSFKRTGKKK